MFKCTGICSLCGRCKDSRLLQGASDRKTKLLIYPKHFEADKNGAGYGVAFDIGTTTVVGMLWDIANGVQVDTCGKVNSQNEFGMDVISRIAFCGEKEDNLTILRDRIFECLNSILEDLCDKNGINKDDIHDIAVCGNTTMSHIFAGYSPKSLARAPFDPAYTGMLKINAKNTPLMMNEEGQITVVSNIAGHVGGDITAGLIASDILNEDKLTVFIDIGTNGEIVLTDGGNMYACSTAAGPAFEGASIKFGMRAADGAIEKVVITDSGEVLFKTIGECAPQGICGSGLIDCVAEMVTKGLIDKSGRLIDAKDVEKKGLDPNFKERLIKTDQGKAFILVARSEGNDILITQADIREVQLAKGAIFAGILLMLEEMGKTQEDIEQIKIAGAFGSYIDKKSAVSIGLLPKISLDRVNSIGNTAGAGVSMILVGKYERGLAESLPARIKHVELSTKASFQETFMKGMMF